MMNYKWHLKEKYPASFADMLPGFNPVVLQLLYNRGLTNHRQVDEFLNPDYTQDIHDPFLFVDMKKAVDRINQALAQKQKILIYGDYDADGVTASVLLKKTLDKLGAEQSEVFIPHRETDGYGLNCDTAKDIIAQKYNLVITVDNGIVAFEAIDLLKQAGIDVIVTDHHLPDDKLPAAIAILNCSIAEEKYPFKKLAGVGVAFKLAQALFKSQTNNESIDFEAFEKWLLDLVTIGTIGDVSPIIGENRTLVKYGLMVLNKTSRLGLRELIRTASLHNGYDAAETVPVGTELYDLNAQKVAFQIVPRINAAGRIDHANLAFNLLTTADEIEAIALARDVHEKNLERQKIADQMMLEAEAQFGQVTANQKILIAANQNWLPGLVGLVAGKLKDKFTRPVIIFSQKEDIFIGSGRSIFEFNITQSLQDMPGEIMDKFGGHAAACGLTIIGQENFKSFKKIITQTANDKLKDVELVPTIELEVQVDLADLNWQLIDELEKFEPFAETNPRPIFMLKNIQVASIATIGKNNSTLRLQISAGNKSQKAISFGTADAWYDKIKVGDRLNLAVEFGVNEWNGHRELQFKIIDFQKI